MREFARLPTRVPPANEAANFARLAACNLGWSLYFAWLALSLGAHAVALKIWTWLVLAPVYWGEMLVFVFVATLTVCLLLFSFF